MSKKKPVPTKKKKEQYASMYGSKKKEKVTQQVGEVSVTFPPKRQNPVLPPDHMMRLLSKEEQEQVASGNFREFAEKSDDVVEACYDTPLKGTDSIYQAPYNPEQEKAYREDLAKQLEEKLIQHAKESKNLDPEIVACIDTYFWDLVAGEDEKSNSKPEFKEKLREKLQEHAKKNPNWLSDMIESLSENDAERLNAVEDRLDATETEVEDLRASLQETRKALQISCDASKLVSDSFLDWMNKQEKYTLRLSLFAGILACLQTALLIIWFLR